MNSIKIFENNDSHHLLSEDKFKEDWAGLYNSCPWSTPYQSYNFVKTWYDNYKSEYDPIIVHEINRDGQLTGLLPLAKNKVSDDLVVAGTPQAEYQVWLTSKERDTDFICEALSTINIQYPHKNLNFIYIPEYFSEDKLNVVVKNNKRVEISCSLQPIMLPDKDRFITSLKKKGNKNRYNRLKRKGNVEFSRVTDLSEFIFYFDQMIKLYDFRQHAVYGIAPFTLDKNKRKFHIDLFKSGVFHMTVFSLDRELISAHIGIIENSKLFGALNAHSPFHADSSPGMLHMILLGKMLDEEGFEQFDLTPGNRPPSWKFRFANQENPVYRLRVTDQSPIQKNIRKIEKKIKQVVESNSPKFTYLKKIFKKYRQEETSEDNNDTTSIANYIYRLKPHKNDNFPANLIFNKNSVDDILLQNEGRSMDDGRLSKALEKLERGCTVYTLKNSNQSVMSLWTGTTKSHYFKNTYKGLSALDDALIVFDIDQKFNDKQEDLESALLLIQREFKGPLYLLAAKEIKADFLHKMGQGELTSAVN